MSSLKPFNFLENVLPSIPQFPESLKSCPRSRQGKINTFSDLC